MSSPTRKLARKRGRCKSILYQHSPIAPAPSVDRASRAEADNALGAETSVVDDEAITNAFNAFDVDGNGAIDVAEVVDCLHSRFGINISVKEAKEMMAVFDTSGDGELDLEEFRAMAAQLGQPSITITAASQFWAKRYAEESGAHASTSFAAFNDSTTEQRHWQRVQQELAMLLLQMIDTINIEDSNRSRNLLLKRLANGKPPAQLEEFLVAQQRELLEKKKLVAVNSGGRSGPAGNRYSTKKLDKIFQRGIAVLSDFLTITNLKELDMRKVHRDLQSKKHHMLVCEEVHDDFLEEHPDPAAANSESLPQGGSLLFGSASLPSIQPRRRRPTMTTVTVAATTRGRKSRAKDDSSKTGSQLRRRSTSLPALPGIQKPPLRLVPRTKGSKVGVPKSPIKPAKEISGGQKPKTDIFLQLAGLSSVDELSKRERDRAAQLYRLNETLKVLELHGGGGGGVRRLTTKAKRVSDILQMVHAKIEQQTKAFVEMVAHRVKRKDRLQHVAKKKKLVRELATSKASLKRERAIALVKQELWDVAIDRGLAPLHAQTKAHRREVHSRWFATLTIIKSARRFEVIGDKIRQQREAATFIQRAVRKRLTRDQERKKLSEMISNAIRHRIWTTRLNLRAKARLQGAQLLRKFCLTFCMAETSRLKAVLKGFEKVIRRGQLAGRGYVVCRQARIERLLRAYNVMETHNGGRLSRLIRERDSWVSAELAQLSNDLAAEEQAAEKKEEEILKSLGIRGLNEAAKEDPVDRFRHTAALIGSRLDKKRSITEKLLRRGNAKLLSQRKSTMMRSSSGAFQVPANAYPVALGQLHSYRTNEGIKRELVEGLLRRKRQEWIEDCRRLRREACVGYVSVEQVRSLVSGALPPSFMDKIIHTEQMKWPTPFLLRITPEEMLELVETGVERTWQSRLATRPELLAASEAMARLRVTPDAGAADQLASLVKRFVRGARYVG